MKKQVQVKNLRRREVDPRGVRRLQWVVGHILRMHPARPRMVYKTLKHISENRTKGDLLMDVPQQLSWEEMRELAENRDDWRQRASTISPQWIDCHGDHE